jgi:hypothetical protein
MRSISKRRGFIHDIVFYVISCGVLCATGTTGSLLAAPPESTNEVSKPDTIQQQIETRRFRVCGGIFDSAVCSVSLLWGCQQPRRGAFMAPTRRGC